MITFSILSPILIGYLIGSFPSAYIVGRLWGRVDLRKEGDGHISATAAYRYLGRKALALVLAMDIGKGVLAVFIASLLASSQGIVVGAAYATVIGHCWSVFLGFKGGLGGAVTFSVLATLALKEAFIGAGVFLVILLFTRKTSWGTYILLGTAAVVLFIERQTWLLITLPLGLIAIHLIKRYQTRKTNPGTEYTHEALDDLKRVNKLPKH
jgi:acyl phosphate:glycerol-3-phosphate acyltransferase